MMWCSGIVGLSRAYPAYNFCNSMLLDLMMTEISAGLANGSLIMRFRLINC